jgi:hypothetical protein
LVKEAAAFSTISLPFPFPYNHPPFPARCYLLVLMLKKNFLRKIADAISFQVACTWHGGRFYPRNNFTKKNLTSFADLPHFYAFVAQKLYCANRNFLLQTSALLRLIRTKTFLHERKLPFATFAFLCFVRIKTLLREQKLPFAKFQHPCALSA